MSKHQGKTKCTENQCKETKLKNRTPRDAKRKSFGKSTRYKAVM